MEIKNKNEKMIIQKAESYLGLIDNPIGSNNIIFNTDYYGVEVSGPFYLWCVVFIWDIFRMCNLSNIFYDGEKTNECKKVYYWGEKNNLFVPNNEGRYGDIVIFSWKGETLDHIGLVYERNSDGSYITIEGNTTIEPNSLIKGVMKKIRKLDVVYSIIRPKY